MFEDIFADVMDLWQDVDSWSADVPMDEPIYDPYNTGGDYLPIWDPYGYVGPASGSIYDPGLGPIYDPYDYNANIYQTLPDSPLSPLWG